MKLLDRKTNVFSLAELHLHPLKKVALCGNDFIFTH